MYILVYTSSHNTKQSAEGQATDGYLVVVAVCAVEERTVDIYLLYAVQYRDKVLPHLWLDLNCLSCLVGGETLEESCWKEETIYLLYVSPRPIESTTAFKVPRLSTYGAM